MVLHVDNHSERGNLAAGRALVVAAAIASLAAKRGIQVIDTWARPVVEFNNLAALSKNCTNVRLSRERRHLACQALQRVCRHGLVRHGIRGALLANVRYYVSKVADRWKVRYDDKDYPFETHSEAVLAATKAASSAASLGHGAEVLVQGLDGKWRTEWPYG
ncbi:DUF2188 domain-containing protein [Mesorhizobium sp. B2-3-3]|nr:DUF2188 domain-containing protein [Mesorhizobium sp. B2-3-3]